MEPIVVRSRTSRGLRSSKPATSGNPGACVPSGTRTGDGPTIQHGTHAIGERVRLRRLRPWLVRSVRGLSQRTARAVHVLRRRNYGTSSTKLRRTGWSRTATPAFGRRFRSRTKHTHKPTTFQNADRGGEVQFHLPTVAMPRHNVSPFYPNARHRPLRTPFLREAHPSEHRSERR